MRFQVLIPGKLRSAPMQALWDDYGGRCRRMGASVRLDCVAKAEDGGGSRADALEREARTMLARLASPHSAVVALTEHGELPDSRAFAARIGQWRDSAVADVAFLVGSAAGLGRSALGAAQWQLALSRMTLPHELVLPVLAEQLYRALSILQGTPYHRD